MARGILEGPDLLIPIVVIFAQSFVECEIAWDLENFLSIRKDDEQRGNCCQIAKINTILEQFPRTEIKHIVKLVRDGQLAEYCRNLESSLNNLLDQVSSCCFDSRDILIKEQIEGIEDLHSTICLDKWFRTKLVKHAKCLCEVLEKSDRCLDRGHNLKLKKTVRSDVNGSLNDPKQLCPRLNSIINCFTGEATKSCSSKAATVLGTLFKRVGRATVRANCGWSSPEPADVTVRLSRHLPKLIAAIVVLFVVILSLILLRWNFRRKMF